MKTMTWVLAFWSLSLSNVLMLSAQSIAMGDEAEERQTYNNLLQQIKQIPIFDGHAHPGYANDPDVDAMTIPPGTEPFRIRSENPEYLAASKALFNYPYDDYAPAHASWLAAKKQQLQKAGGSAYFDGILNKVGITESLANRVSMPAYLNPKRFRWVCFVDSYLFPFDNRDFKARNPDEAVYLPSQEKLLQRELREAGLSGLPSSFDNYLKFIADTITRNKAHGAIAIKFEAAYFRSLHFADPPKEQAAAVYEQSRAGGSPSMTDYTKFQDFVARYMIEEAGKLKLAVHFHTAGGIGDYFSLANGNVLNLENVIRDPRYSQVSFVLLHGGYPFDRPATWLASCRNVYIDSSLLELLLFPAEFSRVLQHWLETFPDKIMFGSDAFPFNEALGSEEVYWLGVNSTRSALAAALARMVTYHEITSKEALNLAKHYLHDTAAKLYQTAETAGPMQSSTAKPQ